jgi:hypothetical protein
MRILRVDSVAGKSIATLWNFAIHGICHWVSNLNFSSDIMGATSRMVEELDGGIALFVNAAAGDTNPGFDTCWGGPDFVGARKMSAFISELRNSHRMPPPY